MAKPSLEDWDKIGTPLAKKTAKKVAPKAKRQKKEKIKRQAPPPENPAPAPFSTYLPKDLQKRLKIHAVHVDRPVWVLVRDAVEGYLERHKG